MRSSLKHGSSWARMKTRVMRCFQFRVVSENHYTMYSRIHTPDIPLSSHFTLHEQWMLYDVSDDRGTSMRMVVTGGVEIHGKTFFKKTIKSNGEYVLREVTTDFVVQMLTKLRPVKERLRKQQLARAENQLQELSSNVEELRRRPPVRNDSRGGVLTECMDIIPGSANDDFDEVNYDSSEKPSNVTSCSDSSVNIADYMESAEEGETPRLKPLSPEDMGDELDSDELFITQAELSEDELDLPEPSPTLQAVHKMRQRLQALKVTTDRIDSDLLYLLRSIERAQNGTGSRRKFSSMYKRKKKLTFNLAEVEKDYGTLKKQGLRDKVVETKIHSVKYQLQVSAL